MLNRSHFVMPVHFRIFCWIIVFKIKKYKSIQRSSIIQFHLHKYPSIKHLTVSITCCSVDPSLIVFAVLNVGLFVAQRPEFKKELQKKFKIAIKSHFSMLISMFEKKPTEFFTAIKIQYVLDCSLFYKSETGVIYRLRILIIRLKMV